MAQPVWKLIANLGDVNPVDHGGYFVYEDTTGVYPPEAELLRNHDDEGEDGPWTVFRFPLERCTFIDGVLSDNEYHPEHPAWFADSLDRIASFIGVEHKDMVSDLCSDDPIRLANAYQAIGDYHGFIELDQNPISDMDRSEIEARYAAADPVRYEVVVGNIGSVYHGTDRDVADKMFDDYRSISETGAGMAGGEDVIMFEGGALEREYIGSLSRAEAMNEDI